MNKNHPANASLTAERSALADSSVNDFLLLMKPRVMTLVAFTGFVGLVSVPEIPHPLLIIIALAALAAGAGAAGAINMWCDRDIDRFMERTRLRPLPSQRVLPEEALAFGVIVSLISVMIMAVGFGWVAAALLALTIIHYVFIYTIWLKRNYSSAIEIGGIAGALPPVIGWTAAGGSLSLEPFILFLLILIWTPPHSWALVIMRMEDYRAAGVPCLPLTAGLAATQRRILIYSWLLIPTSLLPAFSGFVSWIWGVLALILGLIFTHQAHQLARESNPELSRLMAKRLFGFSIRYLFFLFGAILIDRAFNLAE